MTTEADWSLLQIQENAEGISFKAKIQPRASRNQIIGLMGDALKLQLTSPPVDGAANEACIDFLSRFLGVAKGRIQILNGEKSRSKTIRVTGADKDFLLMKLAEIHK